MINQLVKYYLRINHTDDDDCDLFSFDNLDAAIYYIKSQGEVDWILSDTLLEEFEPEDYTHIKSAHVTATARDLLLKYSVRLAVELCTTDAAWYRCQECALSWKGTRDAHPEDTECDVYLAVVGL